MSWNRGSHYFGFSLVEEYPAREIDCYCRLFRHEHSGAQLLHLETEDDNKTVTISFRTPPSDNTGVAHIIEHCVFMGSRKFKTRDPMEDLLKGSLQTFLNAITFPDKTIYPAASRNERDFRHLMDVYFDCVFFPRLYESVKSLQQEGWVYELSSPDDRLTINGIVYNEMLGVFSSPHEVLSSKMLAGLFPSTPYRFESGGIPDTIPDLTYEQFCRFHRTYYHPSNSQIIIYGNGDIGDYLESIDREYLRHFRKHPVNSAIPLQPALPRRVRRTASYAIAPGEDTTKRTLFALGHVIGTIDDVDAVLMADIIRHLLVGTPSSPLRKQLLDRRLGRDVEGWFLRDIQQPVLSVVVKNADSENIREFAHVATDLLTRFVKEGIDRSLLDAAVNSCEFQLREADPGEEPRGLLYSLRCLQTWLYGFHPGLYLSYSEHFERLRRKIDQGFTEKFISERLLQNHHGALVLVKPSPGMFERMTARRSRWLRQRKTSMTPDEIQSLVQETLERKAWQAEPELPEIKATIPRLSLLDVPVTDKTIPCTQTTIEGVSVLLHPLFTNDIVYISCYLDTGCLLPEQIPYLGLMSSMLGRTGTRDRDGGTLMRDIDFYTGGIICQCQIQADFSDPQRYRPNFVLSMKCMRSRLGASLDILADILSNTMFHDEGHLRQIVNETIIAHEDAILSAGYETLRLHASIAPCGVWDDLVHGLGNYRFLTRMRKDARASGQWDEQQLADIYATFCGKGSMLVSVACDSGAIDEVRKQIEPFLRGLPAVTCVGRLPELPLVQKCEGLAVPSSVNHIALGYDYRKLGYHYKGEYQVLMSILNRAYFQPKIRVQGGAYGGWGAVDHFGNLSFHSFRDPRLRQTLDCIMDVPDVIRTLDLTRDELNQYIIGTIGQLDMPLTPPQAAQVATHRYMTGFDETQRMSERTEILNSTVEGLRACSEIIAAVIDQNHFCIIGNQQRLEENSDLFSEIRSVLSNDDDR